MDTYRPAEGRHKSTHYARGDGHTLCGLSLAKMREHKHREGQRFCKTCQNVINPQPRPYPDPGVKGWDY